MFDHGPLNSSTIFVPDGSTVTGTVTVGGVLNLTAPAGAAVFTQSMISQIESAVVGLPFTNTAEATAKVMNLVNHVVWKNWSETFHISGCSDYGCTSTANSANAVWTLWNCSHEEARAHLLRIRDRDEAAVRRRAGENEAWIRAEGERAAARERAEKLLRENLSPRQREELAAKGHFHLEVLSRDGSRRLYQIRRGRSANVKQVDDSGRVLKTLCCHPVEMVPDEDTMLAQKLFLESREEDFLRIANHS